MFFRILLITNMSGSLLRLLSAQLHMSTKDTK